MHEPLVFTLLYLPRPISPDTVSNLLARLASSDVPRPLSLELRAVDEEIQYILGSTAASVHTLKHLLRTLVPGVTFGGITRAPMTTARRVDAPRTGMPPTLVEAEQFTSSIYGALAARKAGETIVIQLVLGRTHGPHHVTPDTPDPLQPISSRLWRGTKNASTDTRRKLQDRAAERRLQVALRIGVDASTPKRRENLVRGVFGSIEGLRGVGLHLRLSAESPLAVDLASPTRMRLSLTARELTPLLGWPLGEGTLPGIDALHPRRLPVPKSVPREECVFALSTAPGANRPIGFAAQGRLQHSVAIGPTGSGKSVLLEHLILGDIAAGRACVVVEPKRQLVDNILDRVPASAAGQVVVLDASDSEPVGFNPLELGPDDDAYVVADNLLAALAAIFEDGWGPRTEYLIQGALVTLLLAGQRRGTPFTLIDLPLLLTDATLRLEAVKHVTHDSMLATFWAEFEEMPVRQRVNQIAAPLNKLRKLVMRKNLVAVLGQSRPRYRLQDVFADGKTVLVPLNEAILGKGAAQLLGSLVVATLWTATLKRATETDPEERPGMIFVDEVQNYLHLPTDVGDAMATSRSYGVAWHVAHQFRAQLPTAMRAGFDTNARAKFVFALGPDDARDLAKHALDLTAEDFQRLGKYEIYCRLVADGAPTEWFSARTLPPAPVLGAAQHLRAASRSLYGALPKPPEEPPPPAASVETSRSALASHRRGQKARMP